MLDKDDILVKTAVGEEGEDVDAEDTGEKGYNYRSGSLKWDVESGMCGIFRIVKQVIGCKCRNMCKKAFSCVCKKE